MGNRGLRYGGGASLLALSMAVIAFGYAAQITPNLTRSLKAPAFIMSPYLEPERGRVASFTPPKGFDPNVPFVKRIAGAAGDLVEVNGDEVLINGVLIGRAKTKTRGGDPLDVIPNGVIAPIHFFMVGETASSLDSRYAFVGYIHRERIQLVGWAFPWAETLFPSFSAARAQSKPTGEISE